MGFLHKVDGPEFGLEERSESFVITFGGDAEKAGIFIYYDEGISGGIELTLERMAELRQLLDHPAIAKRMEDEREIELPPPSIPSNI